VRSEGHEFCAILFAHLLRWSIDQLRYLATAAKYLLIAVVVIYAVDWAVFEARLSHGTGLQSVSVDQFLTTPLKGQKTEYDYLGTSAVSCASSLLPQYAASQWNPPCWYLKRHNVSWK
jgi:hypothetical protein